MPNSLFHIRTQVFGVTQAQMADIARVSQPTISKWEAGRGGPNREELRRIRSSAIKRKLPWDDRLFFEVPEAAE